jgi:serine protease Do
LEQLKDESGVIPASTPSNESKTTKTDSLGLTVAPVDGANKERGVQVLTVEPDSAAQRAGLQRGDIITQLDFVDLDSVLGYSKVVAGLPKNTAKAIRFVRNGTPVFRSIIIK